MQRVQAQLSAEQVRRLKALAAEEELSVAELLRRGADLVLAGRTTDDPAAQWERAFAVVGRYHGGGEAIAERHDDHLGDAFSS